MSTTPAGSTTVAPPQSGNPGNYNPPPGVVPNYINPVSRGHLVFNSSLALVILATAFVLLRFISNGVIARNNLGWHDYTSLIALLWSIARTVGNIIVVRKYGAGRHLWDVIPANGPTILKYAVIDDVLYLMGIMFAKLSILLLYYHIFKINRRFKLAVYALMAFNVAYCGACALAYLFSCRPESKTWNITLPGTCINLTLLDKVIGGLNILTDFLILILPIPIVWDLSMATSKKVGLSAVFGTGVFVLVTTIIREVTIVRTLENKDQTWVLAEQIMWLTLELNIGIICGCMPSFPTLMRYISSYPLVTSSIRLLLYHSRSESSTSKNSMSRYGISYDDSSSSHALKSKGGPYIDLEATSNHNVVGARDQ